ncbi:MAG: hypothetical protein M3033_15535 [Acidobacteriota bacterium]|nr:hypothetical protein [Acidobacteriota bacterium]
MSYKPKYCCQCGEKVERTNWRLWTNRRFCQLCETDYGVSDWIQKISFVVLFLIAIVGVGNLWRKPEKELVVTSNQTASNLSNANKNVAVQPNPSQNSNSASVQSTVPTKEVNSAVQTKQATALLKQNETGKQFEGQSPTAQEIIYFCGARTKKGTPCTRRVKNGGRCWQHIGQPAMLPQDKLVASR